MDVAPANKQMSLVRDETEHAEEQQTKRTVGRPSRKTSMVDEGLAGTRKSDRTKTTNKHKVDDPHQLYVISSDEEDGSKSIVPTNEAQDSSVPIAEAGDDWDTDDENLLQTSSIQDRRHYEFCQQKFGVVPEQLLPDGDFINETGPSLYTRNWNQSTAASMLLLACCPIFQEDRAILQYAISLAMYHRLRDREKPCADILFDRPDTYRNDAFASVEKIPEVVEKQNRDRKKKAKGVVLRDLSAVAESWNSWVVEEAICVEAWNKANPDRFKDTKPSYKELKDYQSAQTVGRSRKDPNSNDPLSFKKRWIIEQRKKHPRSRKGVQGERAENANNQEQNVHSQVAGGNAYQLDTTEDRHTRIAPNSIEYLDLTNDSEDEEDDD